MKLYAIAGAIIFAMCLVMLWPHSPYNKNAPMYQEPSFVTDNNLDSAVVRLHDSNGNFFCSGVVISKNYIATAAHCLAGQSFGVGAILIHNSELKFVASATVAAYEERSDQGLLFGDFSAFNNIALEQNAPDIIMAFVGNHPMITCGYPYGGRAICGPFMPRSRSNFYIAGDGFLYPGMSGGPVIDMTTGKVIAVNSRVEDSLAIVAPLIELLANLHIKYEDK